MPYSRNSGRVVEIVYCNRIGAGPIADQEIYLKKRNNDHYWKQDCPAVRYLESFQS